MSNHCAILILAAGASRRMNGIKQILPFNDTTLLGNAIKEAKNSKAKSIFCILGANIEKIKSIVSFEEIDIIYNENWDEGIGVSIAKGVAFITEKAQEIDAILIILADQPYVNSSYLDALIKQHLLNIDKIIATDYEAKTGVPAIFPKNYFSELLKLNGDNGAKVILNNLINVELCTSKVNTLDIDYPSDIPKN